MDQPGLAPGAHREALVALRRINGVSRTAPAVWKALQRLAWRWPERPVRVLDLACGGGDVLIGCADRARKVGLEMEFHGCDRSGTAVECAREAAEAARLERVTFSALDVLNDALPQGFDVVMSTLFLHHLAEGDALLLLRRMATVARRAVLVDDLARSQLAWGLAWLGCRLFTRSPIVRVDGPLSVRAAFTVNEMWALCDRAELRGATITRHWPARFLVQWAKA